MLVHTILYFYSPQSVKKKKKEKKADLEPADFDNLAPNDFITDDEALLDPAMVSPIIEIYLILSLFYLGSIIIFIVITSVLKYSHTIIYRTQKS